MTLKITHRRTLEPRTIAAERIVPGSRGGFPVLFVSEANGIEHIVQLDSINYYYEITEGEGDAR